MKRKKETAEGFTCGCGRSETFGAYVFAHYGERLTFTCPDCGRQYAIQNGEAVPLGRTAKATKGQ